MFYSLGCIVKLVAPQGMGGGGGQWTSDYTGTQCANKQVILFICWKAFCSFSWILIGWFQTFQLIVLINRRGSFVYHHVYSPRKLLLLRSAELATCLKVYLDRFWIIHTLIYTLRIKGIYFKHYFLNIDLKSIVLDKYLKER